MVGGIWLRVQGVPWALCVLETYGFPGVHGVAEFWGIFRVYGVSGTRRDPGAHGASGLCVIAVRGYPGAQGASGLCVIAV